MESKARPDKTKPFIQGDWILNVMLCMLCVKINSGHIYFVNWHCYVLPKRPVYTWYIDYKNCCCIKWFVKKINAHTFYVKFNTSAYNLVRM